MPTGVFERTPEWRAIMSAAQKRRYEKPEERIKASMAMKGLIRSPEHRANISASKMGHPVSVETRARISAANRGNSYQWAGDEVGNKGMHYRMRGVLPNECSLADSTCVGVLDVSFRWDIASEEAIRRDAQGRAYTTRPSDYWRLCRSHHRRFDKGSIDAAQR